MEKKELSLNRKYSVIKRNDLIQKSKYFLTITEHKIVWLLISKIKYEDEELKEYQFSINEFCEICNIKKNNGGNYETIKLAIKTLADKSFWMPLENDNLTLVRWIEEPIINPNTHTIHLKLNKHLKPYLINIKGSYTTAQFQATLVMKGLYSIRIYELLESYSNLGECSFEIKNLAQQIGAMKNDKDGNYTDYIYTPYDFNRFILKKSIKEINKYTDIKVNYELKKTGNTYTHVYFKIEEKVGAEWYKSDLLTDKALT
jgi:plasmid replication initiation protein